MGYLSKRNVTAYQQRLRTAKAKEGSPGRSQVEALVRLAITKSCAEDIVIQGTKQVDSEEKQTDVLEHRENKILR